MKLLTLSTGMNRLKVFHNFLSLTNDTYLIKDGLKLTTGKLGSTGGLFTKEKIITDKFELQLDLKIKPTDISTGSAIALWLIEDTTHISTEQNTQFSYFGFKVSLRLL